MNLSRICCCCCWCWCYRARTHIFNSNNYSVCFELWMCGRLADVHIRERQHQMKSLWWCKWNYHWRFVQTNETYESMPTLICWMQMMNSMAYVWIRWICEIGFTHCCCDAYVLLWWSLWLCTVNGLHLQNVWNGRMRFVCVKFDLTCSGSVAHQNENLTVIDLIAFVIVFQVRHI